MHTIRIRAGPGVKLVNHGHVAFQLFEHFAANIAARGNGQDLQQRIHRRSRGPHVRMLLMKVELSVEKLQPQKSTHALIKRLLVVQGAWIGGGDAYGIGCGHRVIVRQMSCND